MSVALRRATVPVLPSSNESASDARTTPETRGRPLILICAPLVCLMMSPLLGVGLAIVSVRPGWSSRLPPIQVLQPLHTLSSIGFVLTGICVLFVLAGDDLAARGGVMLRRAVTTMVALFLSLAAGSIVMDAGSGREYLTWAPILTPLLVLIFVLLGVGFVANIRLFARSSPEGAWLIGIGLVCIPLGLIEASLYLLPAVAFDRDISLQWHGLDIVFAGWNALLYGFGILIAGGRGKPLRTGWLFLLAAFCFASTFGHHHYLSPQPRIIKVIAVAASMLAAVSFVRHMRGAARTRSVESPGGPATPFLRAAEWWTLLAVGGGILLAIPQINLVLHGTPAIVGHAMGAMIGVNVMLILGGLVFFLRDSFDDAALRRMRFYVTWTNLALALVWLDLTIAGVVKGLLRFEHAYATYHAATTRVLSALPILGLALMVPLVLMCWEVLRTTIASRRGSLTAAIPGPL